jgi:zinc/manganese transport system permease protein
MLAHEFSRNALLAGGAIALACGLVGYFLVLRAQVFAGDALSHVAFTGAVGAAAAGLDARLGLFAATVLAALAIGALGRRGDADDADDVTIGIAFVGVLGLGVLFLSQLDTGNDVLGVRTLFGSIFGLGGGEAALVAALAGGVCLLASAIARPLLFASVDPQSAALRGVPVRALGLAFLALLGVTAGAATQAVGALLLLGLLAAPAGAAHRLAANPFAGLALSAALALGSMWGGLALAYEVSWLPPSTAVVAIATGAYLVALALARR